MHAADIHEVWSLLDRDRLAQLVAQGPRAIFATVSGAHLYGFASPDSDVDLRGAFLLTTEELLEIHPPKETITIEDRSDIDLDWVAHDLRKFAKMMLGHNGYVMEQLYSPLVVVTSPEHEELKRLGQGCLTRGMARHYLGFAAGRRKRLAEPEPTVKHLLYAYRVYLSGIHLMRAREIESNLIVLGESYPGPGLQELIRRKREGAEQMRLEDGELERHGSRLDALEAELKDACRTSSLPERATVAAELEDFVIRVRLEAKR